MLIPATRYKDCEAALKFMTDVLGLHPHAVHRDAQGDIQHVEMRLGQGLMMFGPGGDSAFDRFLTDPATAGAETTTIYAVLTDVSGAHERAQGAGAEIVMPFEAQDYGGHSFSVRDPEGHVWTIGDYEPLADGS